MRRADEAMRHLLKIVRAGMFPGAKRARRFSSNVSKDPAECAEAVPAGLESDLDDRKLGVAKEGRCSFDPAGQEITVRRQTEGFLEGSCEMRLRDTAHGGQTPDWPLLVKGGVHFVLRAKEPAQQQRFPPDQLYLVNFR